MKLKLGVIRCKRGLETVTAVFMMLLMFAVIGSLVFAFQNYNTSMEKQMVTDLDRAKESLTIEKQINLETNETTGIKIINVGTAEAEIKAIYITTTDGETTYINPSIDQNTVIAPGKSLIIPSSSLSNSSLSADTRIIASTESGIKAVEIAQPTPSPTPRPTPDTDQIIYGALMLRFSGFMYRDLSDPTNTWRPGWKVPSHISCEWRVNVTNVGSRNLILNQESCFTTRADTTSSGKTWNLNIESQDLEVGVSSNVTYVNPTENIYASGTCMVFLTFYGTFQDDGTSYAQTIPFEAITIT